MIHNETVVARPWGYFITHQIEKGWAVKTLVVQPNQMTSLQRHQKRNEIWILVEGNASAIIEGHIGHEMMKHMPVLILRHEAHRLIAGELGCTVVEVIEGEYDEEDIIRLEDKYDRVCVSKS